MRTSDRTWAERVADDLVPRLATVPGITAVVLGGSRARGAALPDSDLDLGLLYRDDAPIDLAALQTIVEAVNDTLDVVPTPIGGWGPWVNGGAWLRIDGHPSTSSIGASIATRRPSRTPSAASPTDSGRRYVR